MMVCRGLVGVATLAAVFVVVRATSWQSNCVSDFKGQVTNIHFSKKYEFAPSIKEQTFSVNQQGCHVVGVKAAACDKYSLSLAVLGPDKVYYSRDPTATGDLVINVDLYCS